MQRSTAADGHFHLHVHTISKLKGHNVLAAAAYRHAEHFRRQELSVTHAAAYRRAQQLGNNGQVFDYRRKVGVTWTGIFAPDHTPAELRDAQTLWNTVERIEHRKNARLAREMIIALPHQVNQQTHIAMLRAFITEHLVKRGMVADVAIHRPPVEHGGDPRNWHAHVLLTDRPMTPDGFAPVKDRRWNAKDNVTLWRQAWADTHNTAMAALGLPHRIDHRSLEAQRQDAIQRGDVIASLDLDRTPQIHVGRDVYVSRRSRQLAPKARRNQQILMRNKQRAAWRADRVQGLVAKADTAAYEEARLNAFYRDTWELDAASIDNLKAAYGRPPAKTALGRLKDIAFDGEVTRRAMAISRQQDHPWSDNGHRDGAPPVLDSLLPMVTTTGPGHPVFTVTAKDLAFAFYGLGFIGRVELQRSLEYIAEEERRQADLRRSSPPMPKPPRSLPAPRAAQLAKLCRIQPVVDAAYRKRVTTQVAATRRYERSGQRRVHGLRRARVVDVVTSYC